MKSSEDIAFLLANLANFCFACSSVKAPLSGAALVVPRSSPNGFALSPDDGFPIVNVSSTSFSLFDGFEVSAFYCWAGLKVLKKSSLPKSISSFFAFKG